MVYNINKFSNLKFTFNQTNNITNIHYLNPTKLNKCKYKFIVFNLEYIIIDNIKYSIKDFINNIYKKSIKYVCFTIPQYKYKPFNNLKYFYNMFPFIEYKDIENLTLEEQYKIILDLTSNIEDKFDSKYKSIQHQYSTYLRFKQNRQLHYKSSLDYNFFFSIKPGYSDVFKLLENRSNRSIYQLDVNSMHPYAMTKSNFSIPSKLQYYKKTNLKDIINKTIDNGIFNCQLTIKNNLTKNELSFIKYFPINSNDDNISIPINIHIKDEINILLHSNEICFYSKYFDIIVEDGVYSSKSITHPLKKWVNDNYEKRLKANGIEKDFYKFILVLSHSIILNKRMKTEYYDANTINNHFKDEFQYIINDSNISNSYFNLSDVDDNIIKGNVYNINNSSNIYSLYSQVLANSRIHLLELYEKIHLTNSSFELCYCNIDSLHISIPNEKKEIFEEVLKPMISQTELGKLKIESIGDSGIWFEPGRYWIYKNEKLLSFKNTIFNDNNKNYKSTFKELKYIDSNGIYTERYFSLFKSLQYKKQIIKKNKNHYIYYKNLNDSNINIINNRINNNTFYKFIFYKFIR